MNSVNGAADGGESSDAAASDAGVSGDATIDAAAPDARVRDAGSTRDAATSDAHVPDASVPDSGPARVCTPGTSESCYDGPFGTRGVGSCRAGTRTCLADGSGFGACSGQVLPSVDDCDNTTDEDCDGIANDGYPTGAGCVCSPGSVRACYSGPEGTRGVGACTAGVQYCASDGRGFDDCMDEVLPAIATCAARDRDCNGIRDDEQDLDGDGYSLCDGDCCDAPADGCDNPAEINPGAFDFAGNGLDEDCTGSADDATAACDATLASDSSDVLDFARAMELCQSTTLDPQPAERRWGVIAAAFTLADGAVGSAPDPAQHALRSGFGDTIAPQAGASLAVLSSGHAAAVADTNPAFAALEPGFDAGTSSSLPADWLEANAGVVPQVDGCPAISPGDVLDPVMLTLDIRAPTNAHAFAFDAYYLSTDFPEWVCTEFSDRAVALLSSTAGPLLNPADGNLATYVSSGGLRYPLSAELAYQDSGLFRQCLNGTLSCAGGSDTTTTSACTGTDELSGTGFEQAAQAPCEASDELGGGTGWLTLSGNVVPGEQIRLRLAIWDTHDHGNDSLLLLDHFRWLPEASTAGMSP